MDNHLIYLGLTSDNNSCLGLTYDHNGLTYDHNSCLGLTYDHNSYFIFSIDTMQTEILLSTVDDASTVPSFLELMILDQMLVD